MIGECRQPLSERFALLTIAVFLVAGIGMLLYSAWSGVHELRSILQNPQAGNLLPLGRPLGAFVVVLALTVFIIRFARLKRVTLIGDRLEIRGLFGSADVALTDVSAASWIQEPNYDSTPVAALFLRQPCIFGSQIHFTPRSRAVFDEFRVRLAACHASSA
jgi:hypothetical protein